MSRLSFRPRPLDIQKKLPIVRSIKELDNEEGGVSRTVQHAHVALDADNEEVLPTSNARGGTEIPTPAFTVVSSYEQDYTRTFKQPPSYIRSRPARSEASNYVEYDLDDEDEDWLEQFNNERKLLTPETFEWMLYKLELAAHKHQERLPPSAVGGGGGNLHSSTDHLVSLPRLVAYEALRTGSTRQAVLAAVFEYWKAKRERWRKPILRRLQPPPPVTDTNPFNVFRPREKVQRPHTRRRRENDVASFQKLQQVRANIQQALNLLQMLQKREVKKQELVECEVAVQRLNVKQKHDPRVGDEDEAEGVGTATVGTQYGGATGGMVNSVAGTGGGTMMPPPPSISRKIVGRGRGVGEGAAVLAGAAAGLGPGGMPGMTGGFCGGNVGVYAGGSRSAHPGIGFRALEDHSGASLGGAGGVMTVRGDKASQQQHHHHHQQQQQWAGSCSELIGSHHHHHHLHHLHQQQHHYNHQQRVDGSGVSSLLKTSSSSPSAAAAGAAPGGAIGVGVGLGVQGDHGKIRKRKRRRPPHSRPQVGGEGGGGGEYAKKLTAMSTPIDSLEPVLLFCKPLDTEKLASAGFLPQPNASPSWAGPIPPATRGTWRMGRGGRIIFDRWSLAAQAPFETRVGELRAGTVAGSCQAAVISTGGGRETVGAAGGMGGMTTMPPTTSGAPPLPPPDVNVNKVPTTLVHSHLPLASVSSTPYLRESMHQHQEQQQHQVRRAVGGGQQGAAAASSGAGSMPPGQPPVLGSSANAPFGDGSSPAARVSGYRSSSSLHTVGKLSGSGPVQQSVARLATLP
ncbi:hypothetical protein CBR_g38268 [Chara braunii]|uniref:Enhancer of polycomb-like protein n=1 Tax=Chara braunii TaxID=69332 RepID=A0A388LPP0_CHABU|nr:hypothetical protein CBR_g38268 [Chara braunii]|eukprot:GBG84298.1 hypothetical protein CBR_g38268 [Chara braunii]